MMFTQTSMNQDNLSVLRRLRRKRMRPQEGGTQIEHVYLFLLKHHLLVAHRTTGKELLLRDCQLHGRGAPRDPLSKPSPHPQQPECPWGSKIPGFRRWPIKLRAMFDLKMEEAMALVPQAGMQTRRPGTFHRELADDVLGGTIRGKEFRPCQVFAVTGFCQASYRNCCLLMN